MTIMDHIGYALLWLSFGALHSILADQRLKMRLHCFVGNGYRFAYNVIAVIHFALIYAVGNVMLGSDAVSFSLPVFWPPVSIGSQALGLVIMLVALSHYDLGLFAGTKQLKRQAETDADDAIVEKLHTDGLHRWVRHPLYFGALLILWPRATDEFALATAMWASAYLVIGAHLEEQRLLKIYGEAYAAYRLRVPMLLPWKIRPA